jgi:hypothetical protein
MGDLLYGNVDHIIPSSRGGAGDDSNFQASHAVCNSVKSDKEDVSFKDSMREILREVVRSIDNGNTTEESSESSQGEAASG